MSIDTSFGFLSSLKRSTLVPSISFKKITIDNQLTVRNDKLYSRSTSSNTDDVNLDEEPLLSPRRIAYFALWASFVAYAFTIAPGGSPEATAIDNQIIQTVIQTPGDGIDHYCYHIYVYNHYPLSRYCKSNICCTI